VSDRQPADTQFFAFGEPDGELFGVATVWDGGSCSSLGTGIRAYGADPDEEWRLAGEGVELAFAPVGAVAELDLADAGTRALHQLAHVRGIMVVDGVEREVDCSGARSRRFGTPDGKRFESLRAVSGWFGGEDGLAVLAARPRRARGHNTELVSAVLLEGGFATPVTEPRLSSTYTADGAPARVGLELWLGDDDDADQYARRAAAEAIGRSVVCGEPPRRSELLRWRMQGRVGVGVYDLLRTR
jgi:hypothetical protein